MLLEERYAFSIIAAAVGAKFRKGSSLKFNSTNWLSILFFVGCNVSMATSSYSEQIVYWNMSQLFGVSLDSEKAEVIFEDPAQRIITQAFYDPGHRRIGFIGLDRVGSGDSDISLFELATGDVNTIIKNKSIRGASWSADGDSIFFVSTKSDPQPSLCLNQYNLNQERITLSITVGELDEDEFPLVVPVETSQGKVVIALRKHGIIAIDLVHGTRDIIVEGMGPFTIDGGEFGYWAKTKFGRFDLKNFSWSNNNSIVLKTLWDYCPLTYYDPRTNSYLMGLTPGGGTKALKGLPSLHVYNSDKDRIEDKGIIVKSSIAARPMSTSRGQR
jgi:hypothetical protein